MREIKFRGKRVDNGDWVTGDLLQIEEDCRIWDYDITDNGVSDTLRLYEIWHNVDPATIGQYTGLRDKNGVEIYEGDICKDALGFRFVVVWDDDARFLGRGIGAQKEYIRYVGQEPAVEVIGNIFDKPTGRER